jgi:hypothetical protein
MVYNDLKADPSHKKKYYNKLSDRHKEVLKRVDQIGKIPQLKEIADYMRNSYDQAGVEARKADIIHNYVDNYVNRIWKVPKGEKRAMSEVLRKFGTSTRHAKRRKFTTIVEGWAAGYELAVEDAANNLNIYKDEIARTIEDKRLIKEGLKAKTADGLNLFSHRHEEGYEEIQHPNFVTYKTIGTVKDKKILEEMFDISPKEIEGLKGEQLERLAEAKGKLYPSKNIFVDDKGQVWERKRLYAPKAVAKNLNKILGVSKLAGVWGVDTLTFYNALVKAWILQSAFFHHFAFTRSYILGVRGKRKIGAPEVNVIKAYKMGIEKIKEMGEDVKLLVMNGLTLGRLQDWSETMLRQHDTVFGRVMDKTKYTKAFKDFMNQLRQGQADFLFNVFGPGLKIMSALSELNMARIEHPEMSDDARAAMVAELINDDFGGLHLQRMGRDPTVQHVFRLFALAPDWTESNVNTSWKMFKRGEKGKLYRRFWTGVITKGITATILANIAFAFMDDDDALERFWEAWDAGNLKWLDVDVTPAYRILGGVDEKRKYVSLLGHFKDPAKWAWHPIRSAHHKGSVLYHMIYEAVSGTDWKGMPFTTYKEFMGVDDKGIYMTNTKTHKAGEPKGGKFMGQLVKYGKGGAIDYAQFPSYALSQILGAQPIPVQQLIGYAMGETDGFDAIMRSIGMHSSTTYPTPKSLRKMWSEQYVAAQKRGDQDKMMKIKQEVKAYNDRVTAAGEPEDKVHLMRAVRKIKKIERLKEQYESR